jgi:threonine dehydrogenase-like Zn-dependent dehydrogenase
VTGNTPRAVIFTAPGKVDLQPQTVSPAPGEVRVTAGLCGISHGTEMLFYTGPFPAGQDLEALDTLSATDYPIKYGYMTTGRTDDGRRVFAFYPHQSEFALLPENLIFLPDELADDDAVFLPSVETAVQIVHDAAPRLGEAVTVFGVGVIGTLVSLLLARMDLTVVVVDPVRNRRDRLADLGFPTLDPATATAGEELRSMTGGGPDVGINTSGSGDALQLAIDVVRPEGTVVEASWFGGKTASLHLGAAFHRRRLTVRASQVSHLNPCMQPRWDRPRRTQTVLRLLGELSPSRFITHRFALDDAASAYHIIKNQPDEVLQVVLDV